MATHDVHSARGLVGLVTDGAHAWVRRDAEADPVPQGRAAPRARAAIALTAAAAAAALAWSLNIEPGEAMFYPATFLVAVIYGIGIVVASRVDGSHLRWRATRREASDAAGIGLALGAVFVVGALLVQFVPPLRDPVSHLLDHARRGNLALVALTTVVNGIAEEAFYRGGLWRVVPPGRRVLWTTVAYTVVTAFAGVPLLALAAALLGVAVALLRQRTGSLAAPVITHLTWSLLMLFVLPHVVR